MHQKLFGGRVPPGPAGELTVTPDLPLHLWEVRAMGKGGRAGRIKREMRGW